ncbi:exported protein of unknown function [Nitrospira moscoviensis]|uniref:Uncharacterized protein n=1 Tax=Nitrospira moscoviensis TaxID=42253 RepID=A0A0K2G8L2_NITMO|nr:exported protein of unknown function [Nitrospira moscoviensis]
MPRPETHRMLMAVLLGAGLFLVPVTTWGGEAVWIDEITALVTDHQEWARSEARDGAYYPYLAQLMAVRLAASSTVRRKGGMNDAAARESDLRVRPRRLWIAGPSVLSCAGRGR